MLRHVTRKELAALPLHQRIAWAVSQVTGGNQTQFAKLVGTSRERVNVWARGKSAPGPGYAEKIAALVDMPADLFRPEENPAVTNEEIKAILEGMLKARDGFFAELRDQLAAQTSLLARLTDVADQLHEVAAALQQETARSPRASRKRRPA